VRYASSEPCSSSDEKDSIDATPRTCKDDIITVDKC
jgi:hypothetical protein